MKQITLIAVLALLANVALSDIVHLSNGGTVRGTVIQETTDLITVAMQYGTVTLRRADVASIEKTKAEDPETDKPKAPAPSQAERLPRWSVIVEKLGKAAWATGLSQIPATVIDKGVLRSVPYMSYRCGTGGDYEVNVYGDPDRPAGIEIGVYGALTKDGAARARCVEFIAAVLGDRTDAALVKAVSLDQDRIERSGLTIEVTPPTAEDAYGGWWVSLYYTNLLDEARASDTELAAITVLTPAPDKGTLTKVDKQPKTPPAKTGAAEPTTGWSDDDLRKARQPAASSGTTSSGGRVYVRGYYRKDGTYVQAHTRSRPKK